ncbi:hypothetical protein AB1Y20_006758 [Prymnesium parvum]|uniref:Ribosomal protein S6 n=1 Tax=Prymnesium parvum TaxID=97485 RepID=A0AB34IZR7_PRYPA
MAPLYNIDLMTKLGPEAPKRLETLLKSAARLLWDRGAVISDMRSWGQLELAYRIRRDSVNHYHAHFLSMQIHCSPPVLHELEESLRLDDHVLRYLTLKQRQLPPLEEGVHKWYLPKKKDEPLDLQADAIEAAKVEYRNLVMQRVFEGRSKQAVVP